MKPIDSIRTATNPDGAIVIDIDRGAMFKLNPTGSRILELLKMGRSPFEIADCMSAEYGVPVDALRADVAEFLDSLKHEGLLDSR